MTRTITQIDRSIDANRRAVLARERIPETRKQLLAAADWQGLRARNPDFDRRDHELYRERGVAQLIRDAKAVESKWLRTRYLKEIAAQYGVEALI